MDLGDIRTCRFCLKSPNNSFKAVDDVLQNDLHSLYLHLNLAINDEPTICGTCTENLQYCLDFKTKCTRFAEHTFVSANICGVNSIVCSEDSMKIDLQNVLEDEMYKSTDVLSNCSLGRFCLKEVNCESQMLLQSSDIEMLGKYIPELDIEITETPEVCTACYNALQRYLGFIKSCLHTEEKILEYCAVESTDCKGQVELSSIASFISKNTLKTEDSLHELKVEESSIKVEENIDVNSILKMEDLTDIKEEITIKSEDVVKPEVDSIENFSPQEDPSEKQPFTPYDNSSKQTTYNCNTCTFRTKYKGYLKEHELLHKNADELTIYKCQFCQYQTKSRSGLRKHLIVHKSKFEVNTHKCTECSYETKYTHNIRRHLLVHAKSEQKQAKKKSMHKCTICKFNAKDEGSLKEHVLTHEEGEETESSKCHVCNFQAKDRKYLLKHFLIHKSKSEVTMYKCTECNFETRHKYYLPRHTQKYHVQEAHTRDDDSSEKTIYECADCNYQTKHRMYLRKHMMIHKNGVTAYKCTDCNFRTVYRDNFRKHVIIHKSSSEVDIHKCTECDFQTKYKRNLQKHVLIHRNSSEIVMLKCTDCCFETKYRRSLFRHRLVHQSGQQATMHKCAQCGFQTKHKNSLSNHIAVHRKYSSVHKEAE